jgi:hypothetical protein
MDGAGAMSDAYAYDHIRRYYWERCTIDEEPIVREMLLRIYWRYMLMC